MRASKAQRSAFCACNVTCQLHGTDTRIRIYAYRYRIGYAYFGVGPICRISLLEEKAAWRALLAQNGQDGP